MRFTGRFGGSTKAVANLLPLPRDSSGADRLPYQLYKHRFAALASLSEEGVEALMPASRKDWEYGSEHADWPGFEGFIRMREEIGSLANALSQGS